MTALCIEHLRLANFRCFEALDVAFDPEVTVIFAENGGGKSTLLTALGMALTLLQPKQRGDLALDGPRDARRIPSDTAYSNQASSCGYACTATIAAREGLTWSADVSSKARKERHDVSRVTEALELVRGEDVAWPLVAWYGTARFAGVSKRAAKPQTFTERADGYAGALDPMTSDAPLLDWLRAEASDDLSRPRRGEPERHFDVAVYDAMRRAVPELREVWFDHGLKVPCMRFRSGRLSTWDDLSDGYHVVLGVVGDIARRALLLNGMNGADAVPDVQGVVMIDEVDLHLHPRWQRRVLDGLRAAFPRLQFVVTTHSPQVLSSVRNAQVRRLRDARLVERVVHVEGKDSNAILREEMDTDDRDEAGVEWRAAFYRALDQGDVPAARAMLEELKRKWGTNDREVILAETQLNEDL